jgi:hypothetical protein
MFLIAFPFLKIKHVSNNSPQFLRKTIKALKKK